MIKTDKNKDKNLLKYNLINSAKENLLNKSSLNITG